MKRLLRFTFFTIILSTLFAFSVFATDSVAKVGDTEYSTLQEAIDAAQPGETVTLLTDLTVESSLNDAANGVFNIAADDNIVIDLGGKTITATDNSAGNFILFYSYGELTIKNGTVTVTATVDRSWNAQSTIILNRGGVLTVESGTYIHNGGSAMSFAFDNSGNSFGDAYMYINGGDITSTYTAIRMRMADTTLNGNPGNGVSCLTVTGGTIYGENRGVWGQITNAYAGELGALDITGGTVGGGTSAIRMTADTYKNIDVTISGEAVIEGAISGEGADFNIKGGTFTTEVAPELFADGYVIVDNGDGTYGVAVCLEGAFTFLGYSISEADFSSIAAGYSIDFEIVNIYCEQNGIESFDFGCAFGIGNIIESTAISFSQYSSYTYFNAKITGIDVTKESHTTAALAMALYVDMGSGKQYVIEDANGSIAFVGAQEVPTVTFAEQLSAAN